MGQCTQCIKRDCGFPASQGYSGRTPEEYEQYLKDKIIQKYVGKQKNRSHQSPDNLTIEKDLEQSNDSEKYLQIDENNEGSLEIGLRKNARMDLTKYNVSYTNILTPCSTQRNIDNIGFLSKRNIEKSYDKIFNSPSKGQFNNSSKTSEELYPSFFSENEIFTSKEDIDKPVKHSIFNPNLASRKSNF